MILLVCVKGTHRSVAVSELLELIFEKYIYRNVTAVVDRIQKRADQEDGQSEHIFRLHLCEHVWGHTCRGVEDGEPGGNNAECRWCQCRVPSAVRDFKESMCIMERKTRIGVQGSGFFRLRNELVNDDFYDAEHEYVQANNDRHRYPGPPGGKGSKGSDASTSSTGGRHPAP